MEESKTIARPYAKAVFDIALSNKQLKEWSIFLQGCSHVVCNSEIYDHEMIINESEAGFAVPYKINSFSDAIIKILKDKKGYSKMSINGRQWLYNNRTYDDIGPKLVDKYRKLINK